MAAFVCAVPAFALEVHPIYGLQMLGGQSFYTGQRGSLSGNVSGLAAPAMKLNENWSLLPSFNTQYQGTQQPVNIIGGQTLFQSQWDNRLALRGIYTPDESKWRLKPFTSFKYQMLQETKDEQLGSGLFDYYQYDLGFDAQYVYKDPFSVRLSLDYFKTVFPNYQSLESQAATQFAGQSLARELVGDRVLDTHNGMFAFSVDAPIYDRLVVEGGASIVYTKFPSQHLVLASGDLEPRLREDVTSSAMVGVKMPTEFNSDLRTLAGLDLGGTYMTSNQNNYDAAQTTFLPFYYNYGEMRISPSFKVLIGDVKLPVVLSVSGTYFHRRYPYRPTQDSTGIYQSEKVYSNNFVFGTSLSYPMAPHFELLFNFQYGRGTSNQTFEQFYKYNYTVANYMFGFSWNY
jgi:hypothetical protein